MNEKKVRVKLSTGEILDFNNVDNYVVNKEEGTLCLKIGGFNHFFNFDYALYVCMVDCFDEGREEVK